MDLSKLSKKARHGFTATSDPIERSFLSRFYDMNRRCNNPNSNHFKNYGGRGIKNEWLAFESFRDDMFPGFLLHVKTNGLKNTHIDRIDNDGNYSKSNTQWVTREQNQNNRRVCRKLQFEGRTQTVTEWSRELGIPSTTIFSRVRLGLSAEKVLSLTKFKVGRKRIDN